MTLNNCICVKFSKPLGLFLSETFFNENLVEWRHNSSLRFLLLKFFYARLIIILNPFCDVSNFQSYIAVPLSDSDEMNLEAQDQAMDRSWDLKM